MTVLIQVGRVTDPGQWRLPWRPEWRITPCDDCSENTWISPKGLAAQAEHPDARVVCSVCWPLERIEAATDMGVTQL